MSYPAISQYLPDPFSQVHQPLVPLTTSFHISNDNVFATSAAATNISLPAGAYLSPIVITGDVASTITLPNALNLIGAFGGTSPNSAITLNGQVYNPSRNNNSFNQVQVGDVFVVPFYNLGTGIVSFANSPDGSGTRVTGPNKEIPAYLANTGAGLSSLVITITALPGSTGAPNGSYTVR